ncbi:hypothetical protein FHU28_002374 [Micromonospora echinospora]|uniref:Uncharacterized protein n=1 Tax=Micromonospora echinospora TaxID=1877 RepID=A0ABR6MD20_MICEC|nr:hypothetical protein [Micromonospora echinospora]
MAVLAHGFLDFLAEGSVDETEPFARQALAEGFKDLVAATEDSFDVAVPRPEDLPG